MHYFPVVGLIRVAFFPSHVSRTPFYCPGHLPCVTSCHHQQLGPEGKPTIRAYAELLLHRCPEMSRPSPLQTDSYELWWSFSVLSIHAVQLSVQFMTTLLGLSSFISWVRMANLAWKRNCAHTFSAGLGCVSHGQYSKTLSSLLLATHSKAAHLAPRVMFPFPF